MGRRILFSPVGGTDPISSDNCRDGSMLHICREYQPDEVYLYLSREMIDFQNEDDRYRYCLDRLGRMQGKKITYHMIERPELKEVQDYDYFYHEFGEIIRKIETDLSEDDELILNISSGTPAMKSGLLVLATLGEYSYKTIQVVTPDRSINEHTHKDYDVATLWELNEDNQTDHENRCIEVKCPTLSQIKQEETIKKLVSEYDYAAAVTAADMLGSKSDGYRRYLQMALDRLQLRVKNVTGIVSKENVPGFPHRNMDARHYNDFEYMLALDIRLKKKEYSDFIRALSPIILDLFEMILEKNCNIRVDDYCQYKNGIRIWDGGKLAGSEVGTILSYHNDKYESVTGPVFSSHLIKLIDKKCSDSKIISNADQLREVEKNVRNIAAHQICSVTDDQIKTMTGYTPEEVSRSIKELFKYAGFNIRKEDWNCYEEMNTFIIGKVGYGQYH